MTAILGYKLILLRDDLQRPLGELNVPRRDRFIALILLHQKSSDGRYGYDDLIAHKSSFLMSSQRHEVTGVNGIHLIDSNSTILITMGILFRLDPGPTRLLRIAPLFTLSNAGLL